MFRTRAAVLRCLIGFLPVSMASAQPQLSGVKENFGVNPPAHFSVENLDTKTDPCVDFYQYSCGGWMARNPRPADEVVWATDRQLQRWNEAILHGLLLKVEGDDPKRSLIQQETGDYFASCMNEKQIEADGLKPVQPELDRIAAIKNGEELAATLGHLHRILYLPLQGWKVPSITVDPGSNEPLFGFYSVQDFSDSSKVVALADQGGLGLPDRDNYLRNDKESVDLRTQYVTHVAKILAMSGGFADPAAAASRVLAIETELARSWMEFVPRQDRKNLNHRFSRQDLQDLMPNFAWPDYLRAVGAPPSAHYYLITHPQFFKTLDQLLQSVSLDDWKTYLRWHLLRAASHSLDSRFATESFAFFDKTLNGQLEQKPRWKRCLQATDRDLGDALGQQFVELTFHPEEKQRVLGIMEAIEAALHQDIEGLPWFTDATKREALAKLEKTLNRVGYPDQWSNYSRLQITRQGWVANVFRASEFELTRQLDHIGKPPDQNEWWMTPSSADAYHNSSQNSINMPAGLLAPPFYDRSGDDAVNFGGFGAAAGHELIHGFDTLGRKYDAAGNLRDWWTPEDAKRFDERAKCVSDQYSQYVAVGDMRINGKLTLPEDLADAGGLRSALMALHKNQKRTGDVGKEGGEFAPEQRFFLSYALTWCSNVAPERLRLMVTSDRHSPPQYRVNGVVSNMPEFGQAFHCKKGQPMVRDNACQVW